MKLFTCLIFSLFLFSQCNISNDIAERSVQQVNHFTSASLPFEKVLDEPVENETKEKKHIIEDFPSSIYAAFQFRLNFF